MNCDELRFCHRCEYRPDIGFAFERYTTGVLEEYFSKFRSSISEKSGVFSWKLPITVQNISSELYKRFITLPMLQDRNLTAVEIRNSLAEVCAHKREDDQETPEYNWTNNKKTCI